MSSPAIVVENLSKKFRIGTVGGPGYHRLSEMLTGLPRFAYNKLRSPRVESSTSLSPDACHLIPSPDFWALRDVSFEVQPGEVVGIIGRNGAGKSTLLKILSRITEPTSGRFGVRGRVASLLEVGTGFHPELTGRENIYVSGVTLGMTRAEIKKRFDEIVDFSGVEKFLDTPVKHYSSGMQVRLGFAVAAHLESDILIIDEVLAVGDAEFQKKSLSKIAKVAADGRTILVVSHSPATIQRLCSQCVYLKDGFASFHRVVDDAVAAMWSRDLASASQWSGNAGNDAIRFTKSWVKSGSDSGNFKSSAAIEIGAELELSEPVDGLIFGFRLYSAYGQLLAYRLFDDHLITGELHYQPGRVGRYITIPPNTLSAGDYRIGFEVGIAYRQVIVKDDHGSLVFSVFNSDGLGARYPVGPDPDFTSTLRPDWHVASI